MITETIKYVDYNGTEREEKFMFNLTKAELMELEMGTTGGLAEQIQKVIESQDSATIIKIFKDLILKAYGEKSADGKRFIKVNDEGVKLAVGFSQTEAYSQLFMKLATDAEAAANFVKGIVPSDIDTSNVQLPSNFKNN